MIDEQHMKRFNDQCKFFANSRFNNRTKRFHIEDSRDGGEAGSGLCATTSRLCSIMDALVSQKQIPAAEGILAAVWNACLNQPPTSSAAHRNLRRIIQCTVTSLLKHGVLLSLTPNELTHVCGHLLFALCDEQEQCTIVCVERLSVALKGTERVPRLPLDWVCKFVYEVEKRGEQEVVSRLANDTRWQLLRPEMVVRMSQGHGKMIVDALQETLPFFSRVFADFYKIILKLGTSEQKLYAFVTANLYREGVYTHRLLHNTSHYISVGYGVGWSIHIPYNVDCSAVLAAQKQTLPWLASHATFFDYTVAQMRDFVEAGVGARRRKRNNKRKIRSS
jgi:hypothetical protein